MAFREPVKFLLVDDLEENLVALEALLRRDDLELIKARSGAEALEMLLVHDIALALLDVQMPEMNGFELAELMRGPERTRSIPIIFVTALPTDEKRRFHGYEMGAVDYLQKPIDPQVLANKSGVFFELARQRQELRAKAEQLSNALEDLQAHTDNSPLACVRFDADLRIASWSKGATRLFGWTPREAVGRSVAELNWLRPEEAARLRETATAIARGEGDGRAVCALTARGKAGQDIAAEWYLSAWSGREGVSLSAQILNVTERRKAEKTQRLLIGELNHRVKNTLATVQAMASQTLKHTTSPKDFARTFTGRIHALSKAHSMLSDATWEGACLSELVRDQLSLGALDAARFAVEGPTLQLKPQQALHFALIIHELATNATKYGAHSTPEGRVLVNWRIEGGMLIFNWTETGGPPVEVTGRRGFGSTLIEHSARAEDGMARMETGADGARWIITMKLPHADSSGVSADAEGERATDATAGEAAPAAKRILIVEDEPLVALDIETALQGRGYEIAAVATSVKEAFEALTDSAIDLVLLDGNLRGHPVDDVADALRYRDIPFLFVSGYGRESLPVDFVDIPILQKPFDHEQLVRCVHSLMQRRAGAVPSRQ
ncbi:response regulator [Rhizobium sp. YJ-22]|uniref:response regulator n=1 Tax=Rhizobium sp. YJ-22 TaxID=3037556 RepID=UPI002412AB29|nr:response regulator [Rhizobium sp. YJ-22]MDG3577935.1 response regulator [Rhizobium sp. YJ-22]